MTDKSKTVTVMLQDPVELNGHLISELSFRKMINKDLLIAEDEPNKLRGAWMLQAELCGQPVEVIERLSRDDADAVEEVFIDMMGKKAADQHRKLLAAQEAFAEKMLNSASLQANGVSSGETAS